MWITSLQDHMGWSGNLPSQARFCRKGREKKTMERSREGGREKKRRKMKVKKGETQGKEEEKG